MSDRKSYFPSFQFKKEITRKDAAGFRRSLKLVACLIACSIVFLMVALGITGKLSFYKKEVVFQPEANISGSTVSQAVEDEITFDDPAADPDRQLRQAQPEDDIRQVFDTVARANLKKDIGLFKTAYASKFSGWEHKKKKTMEMWQQYDFLCLDYYIVDMDTQGRAAKVFIVWEVALEKMSDGNQLVMEINNRATLEKGSDGWEIVEIN